MQGLDALPPWAQVIASIGVLVVTLFVYMKGLFKNIPTTASRDVVVPSLTIADNAAIMGLADTLRDANRHMRDRDGYERDVLIELKQMNRHLERAMEAVLRMGPR